MQTQIQTLQEELACIESYIKFELDGRSPQQILDGLYEAEEVNLKL